MGPHKELNSWGTYLGLLFEPNYYAVENDFILPLSDIRSDS